MPTEVTHCYGQPYLSFSLQLLLTFLRRDVCFPPTSRKKPAEKLLLGWGRCFTTSNAKEQENENEGYASTLLLLQHLFGMKDFTSLVEICKVLNELLTINFCFKIAYKKEKLVKM